MIIIFQKTSRKYHVSRCNCKFISLLTLNIFVSYTQEIVSNLFTIHLWFHFKNNLEGGFCFWIILLTYTKVLKAVIIAWWWRWRWDVSKVYKDANTIITKSAKWKMKGWSKKKVLKKLCLINLELLIKGFLCIIK